MSFGIPLMLVVLIFVILALSIIFWKKTILYIILGITTLLSIIFVLKTTFFYYDSDAISVVKNENNVFGINIKNHQFSYEYYFSRFSCEYSEEELFDKISEQYENTFIDEQFNRIVVVSDNEIFTINSEGSNNFLCRKGTKYILSHNIHSIGLNEAELGTEFIEIPFPNDVLKRTMKLNEVDFEIECSFEHLKQYYESFTNVNIGADTIEIMLEKYKCIITVNGENAHFEIVEI